MVAPTDIKYDFEPANPDPGDDYDKFRERAAGSRERSIQQTRLSGERSTADRMRTLVMPHPSVLDE